jgi:hypothetical protein
VECDAECNRVKAVWQDYRARLSASTAGCRHSFDFNPILRARQFILSVLEADLEWQEEKLVEE